MCMQWLATIGLALDIVGIWMLFWFGAIGGKWINQDNHLIIGSDDPGATARNERRAWWGAWGGLALATVGFSLQIVAQWPGYRLSEWLCGWLPWQ